MRDEGLIGWLFVVVLVLIFVAAMGFVQCVIPGDSSDDDEGGSKEVTTTTERILPGEGR